MLSQTQPKPAIAELEQLVDEAAEPWTESIDDLCNLASSIEQLLSARDRGDTQECQEIYAKVQQQVKCIATLHLNYDSEILDAYSASLKKNGLKLVAA